jgi:hypothetical protein
MYRTRRFSPLAVLLAVAFVVPLAGRADDKDLLKHPVVKPNIIVIFGNSQTTEQTLAAGTAWDGDGDSPNSKMAIAKKVIRQFVADKAGTVNFGLSSFSHNPNAGSISLYRKHWLYSPIAVDYPGDYFAEPIGTIERWGAYGEGPCVKTSSTAPACAALSSFIDLSSVNGATVTDCNGKTPAMFFGAKSGFATCPVYIYLDGNASSAKTRIVVTLTSGNYGDAYTDGTLSAYTQGTYSILVTKQYQTKNGNNPFNSPSNRKTPAGNPDTVTVGYIPSPELPRDNTAFFLTAPVTGTDPAGRAIGFLNDSASTVDLNVGANCSGWEFQSNSNPQPLIKVPRDYSFGTTCTPPQNSIPCMNRLLRAQATLVQYNQSLDTYSVADHDNPSYASGVNCVGSGCYADGCDSTLLGAVDNSLNVPENQVIVINQSGQAPIKGLIQNIYSYVNNPAVDGFSGGVRQDDPYKTCRKTGVILIYDNFNGCQNDGCSYLTNMNPGLASFAALGVPIYVIGFGAGVSATSSTGVCIAQYSGAFLDPLTKQVPGYFPVTNSQGLYSALSDATTLLSQATQAFASASISSVQAGGDQMAYLATFNAASDHTIWDGRISGYFLNPDGSITQGTRTVTDPTKILFGGATVALAVPSNDPSVLKWNAEMDLVATPGTGATVSSAVLAPGANVTTGTYQDSSTDTTTTIPTSSYPGRKIVFSMPAGTPATVTSVPLANTATIPETRYDLTQASIGNTIWPVLKALLGPQADAATTTPTAPVTDTIATESLQFIWGDRDPVLTVDLGKAPSVGQAYKGLKLGDIFHSNPAVVGPPANYFYFQSNLNGYQTFATNYKNRRRILYAGANDGLFHAFDVGVWNRTTSVCSVLSSGTTAGCFDLGTGLELFAYAPRTIFPLYPVMATTVLSQDKSEEWSVDGPPSAADVYIDVSNSGTPVAANRRWRTVIVAGLREGSPLERSGGSLNNSFGSYFALDVTQPEALAADGVSEQAGSFLSPACLNGGGTCAAEWPRVLWEITDRNDADSSDASSPGKGYPDMGETWSKPGIGQVRICTANCGSTSPAPTYDYKFVAVFGGGFDRERVSGKPVSHRGNWLYMVDIETGTVLYRTNKGCKRSTAGGACTTTYFGSIPTEPALLDLNGDGTVDLVYFGDINGRMWRIDLSNLQAASNYTTGGRWVNKITNTVGSTTHSDPFLFFEAPQPSASTTPPNQFFPTYYRPLAISLGDTTSGAPVLGIAWGTGDRDDILASYDPASTTYSQRYYYVIDRRNLSDPTKDVTLSESSSGMQQIASSTAPVLTTVPTTGWYLMLATGGERLITDSVAVNGLLYFSTYAPNSVSSSGSDSCRNPPVCGQGAGVSRFYTAYSTTGNPLVGATDRGSTIANTDFLTNPIFYVSGNMQGNVAYMTSTGSFTPTKPPRQTSSALKEWKER